MEHNWLDFMTTWLGRMLATEVIAVESEYFNKTIERHCHELCGRLQASRQAGKPANWIPLKANMKAEVLCDGQPVERHWRLSPC